MTYATQSVGKIIHHLKQHKSSCYLPKSLTSENEEFHPITVDAHDLEILRRETPRKAELAIKNFGKILMEMDYLKLSFSPVMVEIQGQVYESPRSDFFRSLALFESSFYFGEINWRLLENFQNVAKMYRERVSAFGKSVGVPGWWCMSGTLPGNSSIQRRQRHGDGLSSSTGSLKYGSKRNACTM